jgi:glycosyltransferase involved in cell wall biosynthesis
LGHILSLERLEKFRKEFLIMMQNKKKILFVDHDFGLSGSLISMGYLIKNFVNNGYEVLVLTKVGKIEKEILEQLGAIVILYSPSILKSITLSFHISDKTHFPSLRWMKNITKDILSFINGIILSIIIISKYKPDLIYLNEYVTIQFGIFAKLKSIPVVVHIRSLFIDQKNNVRIILLKKALRSIPSYNFAITQLEADQITKEANSHSTQTIIVPEFLENKDFYVPKNQSQIKKDYGINDSVKVITFLGGISLIKGSITFIRSIEYLNINLNNVKFILAGKVFDNKKIKEIYSYYNYCMSFINKPSIKPYIKIIGLINNVRELISISDVVVSCSIETHFSRPIIEAWAQKKAVVASNIPHSTNLIEHNFNGIITEINDHEALGKTLSRLITNDTLCRQLGENGFLKAKETFTATKHVEKVIGLCSKLLLTDSI